MEEVKNQARSLADAVYRYASLRPSVYAVIDKKGPHTYEQLWDELTLCAQLLKEHGVGQGDRVVMECTQDALFLSVNLSCQLLQAIFVGVERRIAPGRLAEIVRQTEPAMLLTARTVEGLGKTGVDAEDPSGDGAACPFTVKEFEALLKEKRAQESTQAEDGVSVEQSRPQLAAEVLQNLDPETISEILFSTRTTRTTKGAVLTTRANVANAQNIIDGVHMGQDAV